MVKETVVSEILQTGRDVVKEFRKHDIEIQVAAWMFLPEKHVWRLVVATPQFEKNQMQLIKKVHSILTTSPDLQQRVDLMDVHLVSPKDKFIQYMKKNLRRGHSGQLMMADPVSIGHDDIDAQYYRIQ